MLKEIDKEKYDCMLSITKPNVQAYADDIVLYYPSVSGLREML